jgi:hypothetical protein
MMEEVNSSETSVSIYLTTRRYIPDDNHLHARRRENLKSHNRCVDEWSKRLFLGKVLQSCVVLEILKPPQKFENPPFL